MKKPYSILIATMLMLACVHGPAVRAADDKAGTSKEEVEVLRQTTLKLIELMVQSGLLTEDKAQALLKDAKRAAGQSAAQPATESQEKVIRVPFVPEVVREQIREEVRQDVLAQAKKEGWGLQPTPPDWVSRLRFDSEMKVRAQFNRMPTSNAPVGSYVDVQGTNTSGQLTLLQTQGDSGLMRFQYRFGVEAKVDDWISAGGRLVTGNLDSPVTESQTIGTTFGRSVIGLDRAYIRLDPSASTQVTFGKFGNPWFGTDLLWYEDISFEGVVGKARKELSTGTTPYLTLGALPIQGFNCTTQAVVGCGHNKWLYAAQVGFDQKLRADSKFKLGVAYYDFQHVEGLTNDQAFPTDKTFAPGFVQKGNSMFNLNPNGSPPVFGLASRFRELDVTGQFDLGYFDPTRLVLTVDMARNIGFDRQEILQRTGLDLEPRTKASMIRLTAGANTIERKGDWQVYGGFKRVERDAVLDAFNDPDFHLGGTDTKGWMLGAAIGIGNRTSVKVRYYSADEIDGAPLAIDVLQIDLSVKF